jgi:hypothetical protein
LGRVDFHEHQRDFALGARLVALGFRTHLGKLLRQNIAEEAFGE